jgi:hypothetical protein
VYDDTARLQCMLYELPRAGAFEKSWSNCNHLLLSKAISDGGDQLPVTCGRTLGDGAGYGHPIKASESDCSNETCIDVRNACYAWLFQCTLSPFLLSTSLAASSLVALVSRRDSRSIRGRLLITSSLL